MLVQTAKLKPDSLDRETEHQTYCALDCMLTLEVLEAIQREHPQGSEPIYSFERALQAPLLEMSMRGFYIDGIERHRLEKETRIRVEEARLVLDELASSVWGRGLNPRSHTQIADFFYGSMDIPEVWLSFKGERRISANREALEEIDKYLYARPIVSLILTCRDLYKQLNVLTEEIDKDGRHRTSYNIGGTETGRLSSSTSVLGTGGNAQNITPELRRVFVSDPGHRLISIDLEQVEARDVGFLCGSLFGDWTFLDNCESGDLHTSNAILCWPEQRWPRGDMAACRQLAERTIGYRDWSLRDLSKRLGHLSNYSGTAWTASRVLKLPLHVAVDFQNRYCRGSACAYPALRRYWDFCAQRLQTDGEIVTPFGRVRHFFGDPRADTTLREAIAFVPQSMTADRTNLWLYRCWKEMRDIQLLAQTHDSITFQVQEEESVDDVVSSALDLLRIPLVDPVSGRTYIAPGEAKIGFNWAPYWGPEDNEALARKGLPPRTLNPGGLKKWKAGRGDMRLRPTSLQRLGL